MSINKSVLVSLIVSLSLMLIVIFGIDNANSTIKSTEIEKLKNSITKAALHCYSIEGYYPSDLEYLVETYGIVINEDKFHVYYSTFGSNIMPTIEIYRKEDKNA